MNFCILTFKRLGYLALGAIVFLLAIEAIMRLLPITDIPQRVSTTEIATRIANSSYSFSQGWQLYNPHKGHFNNYGFAAEFDYQPQAKPIVFIGDSFIEALMNKPEQRVQNLLAKRLDKPIYALTGSGYSIADYLQASKFARKEFAATKAVIFLTNNDIDEALNQRGPGLYYVQAAANNTQFSLNKQQSYPSKAQQQLDSLTKHSAFIRYLRFQLKLKDRIVQKLHPVQASQQQPQIANHQAYLQWLIEQFQALEMDISFVLDADRTAIYRQESAIHLDNLQAFAQLAEKSGFKIIDLAEPFANAFHAKNLKLDFSPFDGHWNARAHEVVADKLVKELI